MHSAPHAIAAVIAALTLVASPARTLAAEPKSEPAPAPAQRSLLDADQRHPKTHQFAVQAYGGSYLGASVGSSYSVGGRVLFFITRMLGVGVGYTYSNLASGHDLKDADTESIHVAYGQVEMSMDAAVRLSEKTVLETDLFGTFGGGAMRIAGNWEAAGAIGGGLRVYTGLPWLAIRIEILDFLHRTRRVDGSRFESDITFTLGASFLLPPRR